MYVFKIRRAENYSINDIIESKVSASIPDCFDDKSEMEWYCDKSLLAEKIMNCLNNNVFSINQLKKIYVNFPNLTINENGLKSLLDIVINPKDVPYKKSILVSCLSTKNFVNDEDMWNRYTGGTPNKGIMIIYKQEDLIDACDKSIYYGDVKYRDRNELNLTNYWYDWLLCYMKYVDYSKPESINKKLVENEMKRLGKNYLDEKQLIFTKDKIWKKQKEWRIAKNNIFYNYELGKFAINGNVISEQDKCKYGYTIICKPYAIYIRKHVYKRYILKIQDYAKKNSVPLYYETNKEDKQKVSSFI